MIFAFPFMKDIDSLKEHLERAQNPVFFYDNDCDGLCSFILLRRFLGRGKGVAIRTNPEIDDGYARKVQEFNADYVFVLDKPFLGQKFLDEIAKSHVPVVWVDHHDVVKPEYSYENLFIYNFNEPVTSFVYKMTKRKEDLWIAIMGCIADHYLPDFTEDFISGYKELWAKNINEPFDAYYKTEIGLLARALNFGLKDRTSHVVYLQNFLINAESPKDILLELETGSSFGKKYREIKKKYDELVSRAKNHIGDKVVFFKYGGSLSISSDVANELSYLYPKKYIIVAYDKGAISNLSLRGKNVREIFERVIVKFEGASGGGHKDAIGARLRTEDLERFKNEFEKEI